ncbi:MAG: AmmeMemoRadiSam system protein B [Candidatus Omnitrophica bacterium]|nr:AmmeMemoRadiSam system protein B [Candidatus Omnitrophota bacterium]
MKSREPAAAGRFYPGTKASLEETLSSLISRDESREKVLGAISPHAGYMYSGPVAGRVFSRLAPRDLFVIIGPNHTGDGKPFSVYPRGQWKTPLGPAEVDEEFSGYLIDNSGLLQADEAAHAYEHSIEVQLPFLQYGGWAFKFAALCVANMKIGDLKKAGHEVANAISKLKKDATIIASSDMTHYEKYESAKTKDRQVINAILELDEDLLLEKVSELNISMCGVAPVIIALSAAKALGAREAELIDYKTSGDTSGDYSSVVGYGGMIIK